MFTRSLIAFVLFLLLRNEYFVVFFWPYLWMNVLVHDFVITPAIYTYIQNMHEIWYYYKSIHCIYSGFCVRVFVFWRCEFELFLQSQIRCTFSYYICKQWSKNVDDIAAIEAAASCLCCACFRRACIQIEALYN